MVEWLNWYRNIGFRSDKHFFFALKFFVFSGTWSTSPSDVCRQVSAGKSAPSSVLSADEFSLIRLDEVQLISFTTL